MPLSQRVSQTHELKVKYNKNGKLIEKIEEAKDGSETSKDIYYSEGNFLGRTYNSKTMSVTTTFKGRETRTEGFEIIDGQKYK